MAKKKLEDALKNGVESRLKKAANIVTSSDALRQELEEATQTEKKTVRQKSTAERTAERTAEDKKEVSETVRQNMESGEVEEMRITEENSELSEEQNGENVRQNSAETVRQNGTAEGTAERTAEIKQKRAAEIRQKMKRTGRTGRQEKKARVELRVTEEVKKDVEDLALLNDMSVTEYLVSLVAEDRRRNRSALNDLRTI